MTYLTLTQINEAAKTSDKAALECSRLHWEQIATWLPKAFIKACFRQEVSIKSDLCACCHRYQTQYHETDCRRCPLGAGATELKCCNGLWVKANDALIGYIELNTLANYKKFYYAAKAVERYIAAKIEEME